MDTDTDSTGRNRPDHEGSFMDPDDPYLSIMPNLAAANAYFILTAQGERDLAVDFLDRIDVQQHELFHSNAFQAMRAAIETRPADFGVPPDVEYGGRSSWISFRIDEPQYAHREDIKLLREWVQIAREINAKLEPYRRRNRTLS
jgi:hypothetical protein